AVRDGDEYVINGEKIFTTNSGFADTFLVFAVTDKSVPAAKGMSACLVTVFIVAIDVILRKLSGQRLSISGSNEISQYLLVVMCMFAIPMLQIKRGHVWVDMFVNRFPKRFRSCWLGVITAIETIIAGAFTVGCYQHAMSLMSSGRTTDVLNMPWWPFAMICAIGFLEFTVILLIDSIIFFQEGAQKSDAAE
ncbi:MAG: TRAP transporter small permease subunit, partial [Oscillospiraceae bacterium]|nr:TRAP transporter small permease subunit [Oscillospiraceae bacterium]